MAYNSILNLSTGLIVIVLNMIFVPLLIRSFGLELFAVLSITWMVLANLAWLDFGFSRATARFVARELTAGTTAGGARWTWVALTTQAAVGACAAALLIVFATQIVSMLNVDPSKRALVIFTLHIFAFAIPVDLSSRALNGVLEAGQRFGRINGLNLFQTFLTFGIYGVGISAGSDFKLVIIGLFLLRILMLIATFRAAYSVLPELNSLPDLRQLSSHFRPTAVQMLRFGWWVSVAAFCGSLLMYFDRWVIGSIIGIALLPFFTVPMSLLARLSILPGSIVSTLFPAMAALHAQSDWATINDYFLRAQRFIVVLSAPVLFLLYVWAPTILSLWISGQFSAGAYKAMRILIIGFAFGMFAPIVGSLLEAKGRPDVLAKVYLIELPFNVLIVVMFTRFDGLLGAALSFAIRGMLETILLWIILYRTQSTMSSRLLAKDLLRVAPFIASLALVAPLINGSSLILTSFCATIAVLAAGGIFSWFFVLNSSDRGHLLGGRQQGHSSVVR